MLEPDTGADLNLKRANIAAYAPKADNFWLKMHALTNFILSTSSTIAPALWERSIPVTRTVLMTLDVFERLKDIQVTEKPKIEDGSRVFLKKVIK